MGEDEWREGEVIGWREIGGELEETMELRGPRGSSSKEERRELDEMDEVVETNEMNGEGRET